MGRFSSSQDEVTGWLDNIICKLEDSGTSFGEAATVNTSLHKYKVSDMGRLAILNKFIGQCCMSIWITY